MNTKNQEIKQQILNVTALHVLPYSYYQSLKKFIQKFCNLLDEHNIEYWCYGGAVLGKARFNGLLPWDDDFDICIMDTNMEKLNGLTDVFKQHKIRIDVCSFLLKAHDLSISENQPFIDIFEMTNKNGKVLIKKNLTTRRLLFRSVLNYWPNHNFTLDKMYPLQKLDFENYKIYFSNDYLEYLNRGYKDWENTIILNNFHIKKTSSNSNIPEHRFNIIKVIDNKLNDCKYIWSFNKINNETKIHQIILTDSVINKFLPNLGLINIDPTIKNELIKYLILFQYGGIYTDNTLPITNKIVNLIDKLSSYDYISVNDKIILSRPYSNLFTIFLDNVIEKIINNQGFDIKSLFNNILENFVKNQNYEYLKLDDSLN